MGVNPALTISGNIHLGYCYQGTEGNIWIEEKWSVTGLRELLEEVLHDLYSLSDALRVIDGVTGRWKQLHNEQLHNLYSSPSIIRIIKSRRVRWAGHVARMVEKRNA
jgi:hypothetical protein